MAPTDSPKVHYSPPLGAETIQENWAGALTLELPITRRRDGGIVMGVPFKVNGFITENNGKSPFLMGKSTFHSMFNGKSTIKLNIAIENVHIEIVDLPIENR